MEDIEKIRKFVAQLDGTTEKLQNVLQPLLLKQLSEHALLLETPQDRIKLYNNNLYVIISVLYSYLKLIGEDTKSHPIMNELTRIKLYMARAKELETNLNKKESTADSDASKARQYLQQTLGSKVNGGGAATTDSMKAPAISKHTKFIDNESDEEITVEKVNGLKPATTSIKKKNNNSKKKVNKNKVTKPQKK